MAILWDTSWSVHIKSIDDQHKKLIDMVNDFYENINNRSNTELILKLVEGMKAYTLFHFTTEEKYMNQYNYPDYEIHKKEHVEFIEKVNILEEKVRRGTIIVSFEITSFLKDWIKKHIQETDKKYSGFFVRNGIK